MKSLSRQLIPLLLFAISSPVLAEDLLEKHLEAVGCQKALSDVKTMHREGTVEGKGSFGAFTGQFELSANLFEGWGYDALQLSISGYDFTQRTGWSKEDYWMHRADAQVGVADMPPEHTALQAYLYAPSPLAAIAKSKPNLPVRRLADAEFDGATCNVLMLEGYDIKFFLNQNTHLLHAVAAPGMKMAMSDYKIVEGIQIPSTCDFQIDIGGMEFTYTFTSTIFNVEVDARSAKRPSPDAPPPTAMKAKLDAVPDGTMTAKMLVGYLDKNSDRLVDLEEYILSHKDDPAGQVLASFKSIDVNSDGGIDVGEAQVMADYVNKTKAKEDPTEGISAEHVIEMMDKNSDGKIAKEEAVEDVQVAFGDLDTNADGFIDVTEAEVMAKYASEQAASKFPGSSKPAPKPGAVTAEQLMSYMDTDGDNKISKEEANDELKANFQYVDTNGDGFLDLKETQIVADYANKQ